MRPSPRGSWPSLRSLLVLVACTIGLALLAPVAASAASAPGSAVVLVSGFTSTSPFSTPAPVCDGNEGPTWSSPTGPAAALKAAGYTVFTAPVANHGKAAAPCLGPGQVAPPASATIDSNGDTTANGQALLTLLSFVRTQYGITSVQLVGHSDGGLWSRSAITQLPQSQAPEPTIQSLLTLGTPHTGSFGADLAEYVHDGSCDTTGIEQDVCEAILPVLDQLIDNLGAVAVNELSSSFLEGWNRAQSIGCPVTVVAGTYVTLPSWFPNWLRPLVPSYYFPNDGIVGEASGLNQTSTSLTLSSIPAAPFTTIAGGTYPVIHTLTLSRLLGTDDTLTNDAAIAAKVVSSIGTTATSTPCVARIAPGTVRPVARPALAIAPPSGTVHARFATHVAADAHGRLGAPHRGDVALLLGNARVVCGRHTVTGTSLLGSRRLRLAVLPRCPAGVRIRGKVLVVRPDPVAGRQLAVRWTGSQLTATVHGAGDLRGVRIELQRDGRHWTRLPASGRGSLPLGAGAARHVAVRAIGYDAVGDRFVATAQIAR